MHLYVRDTAGINTGISEYTVDQVFLSSYVGSSDGICFSRVVGPNGQDAGLDGVSILDCVVQTFEDG